MIWNWLTERRRKHILENAFPAAWEEILVRNVGHYRALDEDERERLRALVQVFIAEKHWEGCGGLELDDEMRVTIAAEACLLLLGRDHSLYSGVDSILVYPSTVVRPKRRPFIFGRPMELESESPALLGEAMHGGPVILVWDAVRRTARDPADGHSVVIHEFAHKIDMLDGGADGTPPMETSRDARAWAEVFSRAFFQLKRNIAEGNRDVLDPYGATNEAEFFAVATEAFFDRPCQLEARSPDLYRLLAEYYRQDTAARARRAEATPTNLT